MSWIFDILRRILFGSRPSEVKLGPRPILPRDNLTEPARIINSRVLLVNYDPVIESVQRLKLSKMMKWSIVDDLANRFIQDILEVSGGLARYQIVFRIELNEFPAKIDGYRYNPQTYLNVLHGEQAYQSEMIDYQAILTGLNILQRISTREIDEVWVFAFPHAGFYESVMAGEGAFWCNAPPLIDTKDCQRKFVIMGFSIERGVGEMLESFGHRSESILAKVFENKRGEAKLFQRFIRYDLIAPGKAEVGTIHFAPNSKKDYEWNNSNKVLSKCYDWYNYPKFKNDIREVNADEWGGGDIYAHHKWWLSHIPKVAGRTKGIVNNWWQYIIDPNLIFL